MMKLGTLGLSLVDDGDYSLDGGTIFGAVPKVLWENLKSPDEDNLVRMATNSLLVERGSDLLLIDTGIGDRGGASFRQMFGMEDGTARLPETIQRAGYDLGDVTHVLLTHLHFDHCGWNTRGVDHPVPTFPNARYWLERGEVEHARNPNARDRSSYQSINWEPLFEAGVVELFDDRSSPIEGVEAVKVPGHNSDMCIVLLDGGDNDRAVWWADLVPTVAHVPYAWIMSFDLFPLTIMENKQQWIPRAAREGWLCFFGHETDAPVGRLVEERAGRYRSEAVSLV